MSRSALSLAVGMARSTCSELEARSRIASVDTAERLAQVLKLSPCFLAFGVEQPCEPGDCALSAGLPARLAQLREERGLSRRALGRLSGTSDNFVQKTETSATVPSIARVEALAEALKVSVCWLAYGVGERDLPPRRRPPAQFADPAG